ncbi:MAG: ABC transporter permease [Treponema sp.]|nr:ABC transporter permease [Treponema sp.]
MLLKKIPAKGPMIALGSAILLALLLITISSPNPSRLIRAFFLTPWSSPWFLGNTLDGIALLLVASLGAAIAFRGGTFNLGGEGQIYAGGLASSMVLLSLGLFGSEVIPAPLLLCLAALSAIIIGGLIGGFSGLLKKTLGINELISSFLLSSALIPIADHLIGGPWRDPSGTLLALPAFPESLLLPRILPPSNLSHSFFYALLLVFCGYIFIDRTAPGYKFRIAGAAPGFARFGGIKAENVWLPAMTISGALAGLTGFFAVAGSFGRCHVGFSGGLGWSAIAVALIAGNKPLALLPAALVFGWLQAGSNSALLSAGLNIETSSIIQAVVLILITARWGKK